MRIAYIILAHQYPEQLICLIKRLTTESTTFFIHVDKKVDLVTYQFLLKELEPLGNVFFLKRFVCFWAGFGIVQATFQGIREIMERGISFDYLVLLSGQDYPIKTNKYIYQFFQSNEGKSFIQCNRFPYSEWNDEHGGWDRVNFRHIISQYKYYVLPPYISSSNNNILKRILKKVITVLPLKRKFPGGLHPYGGAQFWCLHKTHAQYIYHFICKNPKYFHFFRFVYVPDEILFQTIMGNSEYTRDIVNNTLHYVEWQRPGKVLLKSDLESIRHCQHLFARKFDSTVDPEIFDLIDREILDIGNEQNKS